MTAGLEPPLRQITVIEIGGKPWRELGYHSIVRGLAVNQTERSGSQWWTITHLSTGRSVGVVVASKDRAARLCMKLAAPSPALPSGRTDWGFVSMGGIEAAALREHVRHVCTVDALVCRHKADGRLEFLDPQLALLEFNAAVDRQRELERLTRETTREGEGT